MAGFDPCDFLFDRWKNLALWRNLWTILIFLLGSAFTIFLIGAVMLFIRASWIAGALATLGTIVNGVAVGWILARRNQAVTEETEAKEELIKHCAPPMAVKATEGGSGSQFFQMEDVERRLRLFGRIR